MPVLFYIIAITLLLVSFRKQDEGTFLDKSSTNVIKGFFILLIIFSHILNEFEYTGFLCKPLGYFRAILGQLLVSMFFFISGYGIFMSLELKKDHYKKTFLINRFFRIFLYGVVGMIPYFIYSACIKEYHPVGDYFLSFIGLKYLDDHMWFLFAILFCYLVCGTLFLFNIKNKYTNFLIISLSIVAYIAIMCILHQPAFIWNTIISFIFGMFVSMYKDKILKMLKRNKIVDYSILVFTVVFIIIFQYINYLKVPLIFEILIMIVSNFSVCLFFVTLTFFFKFSSKSLGFIGKASFPIFITHPLIIFIFVKFNPIQNPSLNYFVLLILCICVGIPFFFIDKFIDNKIINPLLRNFSTESK